MDRRFDDQLAAMVKAREEGLIGGIDLSGVTREQLLYAAGQTEIVCAQNLLGGCGVTAHGALAMRPVRVNMVGRYW